MSSEKREADAIVAQKRKQRTILIAFGALCILVIGLRLKLLTKIDAETMQPLYNQICEELKSGTAFSEDTWKQARRHVRRAAANPSALFTFQYVSTVMGKTPLPAHMELAEGPIRAHLHTGEFDQAQTLVRDALLDTDAMPAERARIWGQFIREMERRWENDCLPVERAVDALPTG